VFSQTDIFLGLQTCRNIQECEFPITPHLELAASVEVASVGQRSQIKFYPILSYPILSYPILSYPILSYPVSNVLYFYFLKA
jgi:hypothetical protein